MELSLPPQVPQQSPAMRVDFGLVQGWGHPMRKAQLFDGGNTAYWCQRRHAGVLWPSCVSSCFLTRAYGKHTSLLL